MANMEGRALRQQPGFACEECRKRKARCDRGRPKCGFCTETGTTCVIVDKRQQRGPKKGLLNRMRLQIDQHFGSNSGGAPGKTMPERDLDSSRTDVIVVPDDYNGPQTNGLDEANLALTCATSTALATTTTSTMASTPVGLEFAGADLPGWVDCIDWQDLEGDPPMSLDRTETVLMDHVDAGPSLMATRLKLTDLMRADLDQLYFDRVHPVCPMVHRRRYFAWAGQESLAPARACLQSAMRTMAAAMSVHWCYLVDHLCAETRHLLETQWHQIRAMSKDEIPLEHIQAWLLLAYSELLRMGEHQAMLTAGRAFRLVQMARLYDVDAPDDSSSQGSRVTTNGTHHELDEGFADAEERRRTFWLAFSLDHFLCLRSEWPLTLQEEMIRTRLPAPEANFQNNQHIRVSFLPEAVMQNGPSTLSPFAECVVLAALHGRCMTHRRAYMYDGPTSPGTELHNFWTRQEWLASAVEKRLQMLVSCSAVDSDPMLLFAQMLAHSAVVFHSNTVQRRAASFRTLDQHLVTGAYDRRASVAALEIVRLAKAVPSLGCFKAHPFLPDPLTCAATFLSTPSNTVVGGNDGVEHLLRVLRDVQVINSLAREHFQ
ncbi:Oleate activated transcription factor 3 [Tolypocladium ophioglossoides CBS 100239]|uniref:Oleate activated transcription factor 3 n=1 Tax=Tolypocladium ophioglossoides (strain CBS 100239) TaxID=1163406 RepID=A0A0L0MZL3_TOLOC|nr:Oleate activated transcription factor 3 [Tolypocladium ophioglossoides CBS 100239]